MLSKNDLLSLMLRECDICVHLHSKIPAGTMDFRLSPAQRSTVELLRYLSFIGIGATQSMVEGKWDAYQAAAKAAESLESDAFPAAMERQKDALRALFAEVPEADFTAKKFTLPWEQVMPLGMAIITLPYGSLVAYRMQLFLHAKAAGNSAIGTSNCWAGTDMPA